jgi:maltose O-acetyltransferase
VTVGDPSVVASSAVVTGDVPEEILMQGDPKPVVKELD